MELDAIKQSEAFLRFAMQPKQMSLIKPDTKDNKKLLNACQEFEAIFVKQLLKEMRKTVPKDGVIPENNESSLYKSMFDDEIANNISKQGSLGLAESLYEQIRDRSNDKKIKPDGVEVNGTQYLKLKNDH